MALGHILISEEDGDRSCDNSTVVAIQTKKRTIVSDRYHWMNLLERQEALKKARAVANQLSKETNFPIKEDLWKSS